MDGKGDDWQKRACHPCKLILEVVPLLLSEVKDDEIRPIRFLTRLLEGEGHLTRAPRGSSALGGPHPKRPRRAVVRGPARAPQRAAPKSWVSTSNSIWFSCFFFMFFHRFCMVFDWFLMLAREIPEAKIGSCDCLKAVDRLWSNHNSSRWRCNSATHFGRKTRVFWRCRRRFI